MRVAHILVEGDWRPVMSNTRRHATNLVRDLGVVQSDTTRTVFCEVIYFPPPRPSAGSNIGMSTRTQVPQSEFQLPPLRA